MTPDRRPPWLRLVLGSGWLGLLVILLGVAVVLLVLTQANAYYLPLGYTAG
jgi:hypothetical protein